MILLVLICTLIGYLVDQGTGAGVGLGAGVALWLLAVWAESRP